MTLCHCMVARAGLSGDPGRFCAPYRRYTTPIVFLPLWSMANLEEAVNGLAIRIENLETRLQEADQVVTTQNQ